MVKTPSKALRACVGVIYGSYERATRSFGRSFDQSSDGYNMVLISTSTPQLPFKVAPIPASRDHKALNRGLLEYGSLGHPSPILDTVLWANYHEMCP